jgi:methylenetetrahydrofolate dehydrogenase (NADP+)/methenyltetrahydrofolate cyclohydrolase
MVAKLLDGKKTAREYLDKFKKRIAALQKRTGRTPRLCVILVGDDPASLIYDRAKVRRAAEIGMESELVRLPETASEEELLALIEKLDGDESVNGILVQLPLPARIDRKKILAAIDPAKDVDGFHPMNKGLLATGDETGMVPCTPLGILRLLERYGIGIEGARAVVVGRSDIVGRPLSTLLLNHGATVTTCHSKTRELGEITREADILVSAVGRRNLIRKGDVKPGAAVIDVAMVRDAETGGLRGDVDFDGISEVAKYVTPVPGGVGPMTIAMLMGNTIRAFCIQNGIGDGAVRI